MKITTTIHTHSYTQRLQAYVLLLGIFFQSCYNPLAPLPVRPPVQGEEAGHTVPYPLQSHREEKECCIAHSHAIENHTQAKQLTSQNDPGESTQVSNKKPSQNVSPYK